MSIYIPSQKRNERYSTADTIAIQLGWPQLKPAGCSLCYSPPKKLLKSSIWWLRHAKTFRFSWLTVSQLGIIQALVIKWCWWVIHHFVFAQIITKAGWIKIIHKPTGPLWNHRTAISSKSVENSVLESHQRFWWSRHIIDMTDRFNLSLDHVQSC